jgi:hypothetical protein
MSNSITHLEFVLELTDYFDKKLNNSQTNNSVFINQEIKAQLNRFNKTPFEAQRLLTDYKSTFPPDFFENVVKPLIEKLNDPDFIRQHNEIKKKDIRYWLTTIYNKEAQNTDDFQKLKYLIETNGHFIINSLNDSVKVYSPELALIFCSNALPAQNMDTKTETTINGYEYIKTYLEGYKKGEQYFEDKFKVSPNVIYGENAEQYVRDIHLNYYHVQHTGTIEGWGCVKTSYLFILTHKGIQEFGYYSGIVNKVDEQRKNYPKQFATFDKCEHNLTSQPTETKTDKIKAPVLGLFCCLINKIGIDKKEETESATVYCERICGKFKLPYTDRVRQNYNVNETKKLIQELTEKVLPLIDNETKILVEKYLDSKQPPKQNLYA